MHTENSTILLVDIDSVLLRSFAIRIGVATFNASVDDVDGFAESLAACNGAVAGGFGRLRRHPKPNGCLERNHWIGRHNFRVVDSVKSDSFARLPVVVIP